jgi:GLPGLI family protein
MKAILPISIIITSILNLTTMAVNAQQAIFSVVYKFEHQIDSGSIASVTSKNMLLQVTQLESKFFEATSFEQMLAAKAANESGKASVGATPVMGGPIAVVNSSDAANEEFYQLIGKKQLITTVGIGFDLFKVSQVLPAIAWQLNTDTKQVLGYNCQKAIGAYKGRVYTVWFTQDLPYSFGPWKLNGLPGVILEAEDSKKQIRFTAISVKREQQPYWENYTQAISTTEQKLLKAKRNFEKDPLAMAKGSIGGSYNGDIPLVYVDDKGNSLEGEAARKAIEAKRRIKNNNPLELTP